MFNYIAFLAPDLFSFESFAFVAGSSAPKDGVNTFQLWLEIFEIFSLNLGNFHGTLSPSYAYRFWPFLKVLLWLFLVYCRDKRIFLLFFNTPSIYGPQRHIPRRSHMASKNASRGIRPFFITYYICMNISLTLGIPMLASPR